MHSNRRSEAGFTLVELAIVIAIAGLLLGGAMSMAKPFLETAQRNSTIDRQKNIARVLTSFAQANGRLPCPAEADAAAADFGRPLGYTAAEPWGECDGASDERRGIVPYRVLGLTQQDITDGWKRPFSYTVDAKAVEPEDNNVHARCRLDPGWMSGTNLNPGKASFCCQENDSGGRLMVFNDVAMGATDHAANVQDLLGDKGDVDTAVPAATAPIAELSYFSYALVSHGTNGAGAFILNDSDTVPMGSAGDGEEENADDDENIIDIPLSRADGDEHFDDIVLWRTQRRMMTEFGNDSCDRP
jgi:prepilin-type N-terminal cleavage/methylation domain-containing protein